MRARLAAKLALVAGFLGLALVGDLGVLALLLLAVEGLLLASRARQRVLALAGLFALPFALLNAVLVGSEPLAALGPLALHREGLLAGLAFAGRALVAVGAGLWVLHTTRPREALRLLARWPRAALACAATMRFAPLAAEDWERVREAQALRAPERSTMAPLLVPLFVATVRRGRALEEAIAASAFGSGPRTAWPRAPWRALDVLTAALGLALLALAAWRLA